MSSMACLSTERFGLVRDPLETPAHLREGIASCWNRSTCTMYRRTAGSTAKASGKIGSAAWKTLRPGSREGAAGRVRRDAARPAPRRRTAARMLLRRAGHAEHSTSCRPGLHRRLRRGAVPALPSWRHPMHELRRQRADLDGRPRDAERCRTRAPAGDEREDSPRRPAEPVPPPPSRGDPLAAPAPRRDARLRTFLTARRRAQRASWKIRPSVLRSPERSTLTPWRTFAR